MSFMNYKRQWQDLFLLLDILSEKCHLVSDQNVTVGTIAESLGQLIVLLALKFSLPAIFEKCLEISELVQLKNAFNS